MICSGPTDDATVGMDARQNQTTGRIRKDAPMMMMVTMLLLMSPNQKNKHL
jgi:hypothetical protein